MFITPIQANLCRVSRQNLNVMLLMFNETSNYYLRHLREERSERSDAKLKSVRLRKNKQRQGLTRQQNLVFIPYLYYYFLSLMHSKIYKARLINTHSDSNGESDNNKILQSPTIHAYYGMLQHVFQRNRHMIKQLKLSGIRLQQTQEVKKKSLKRVEELSGDFRNSSIRYKRQQSFSVKKGQRVQPSKMQAVQVKRSEIHLENTVTCFMPIGQAFQNRQIHKPNKYNPDKRAQKGYFLRKNILSPSQRRYPSNKESYTQRDSLLLRKPFAAKGKRSFTKMKSQGCEETNYSSIRNSQKSNPEPHNAPSMDHVSVSEVVAPW